MTTPDPLTHLTPAQRRALLAFSDEGVLGDDCGVAPATINVLDRMDLVTVDRWLYVRGTRSKAPAGRAWTAKLTETGWEARRELLARQPRGVGE